MVCMQGASKPVSHMSRTRTSFSGSAGSFARLASQIAARLVADVRLPFLGIGGDAGHHDLDGPRSVVIAVPVRSEFDDFLVKRNANAATHAHGHGLAIQRGDPRFQMIDEILGDKLQPLFGAHESLDRGPFLFEPLLLVQSSSSVRSETSASILGFSASSRSMRARRLS